MRIAVLGSSGQIGAYLTEYLRRKDHEVHEFDIVNGRHHDMTEIPNPELHRVIMTSDFVFFLAFDVIFYVPSNHFACYIDPISDQS